MIQYKTTQMGIMPSELAKDAKKQIEANFAELIKTPLKQVQQKAKANINDRTGLLKSSLIVKITKPKSGGVWAGVGVNAKAKGAYEGEVIKPHKYAHLVEAGFTHKYAGKIEGKGFMRKASTNMDSVSETLLNKALDMEIKRQEGLSK